MRMRQIEVALLSVLTTLASASTALGAHGGGFGADDGRLLSLDSLALAVATSLVLCALCFGVMVWDPTRRK